MSSEAPQWVDAALVQRALRGAGEDAVRVLDVEAQSMSAEGGNITSRLFRLRARVQHERSGTASSRSLVLKCEADEEGVRETTRLYSLFARETACYTRILPEIHEMLERAAPGRFPPLAPRCLLHGEEPYVFLILDDLSERGYRVADRLRGLGLRHSLLAVAALARYHAASAALLARNPSVASLVPTPWKTSEEDPFSFVIQQSLQRAAEACRGWADFPKEYSEYLDRMKSKAYDKFATISQARPGEFNVINHADYWTNNIMYRYADGVPVEMRIIDFQMTSISPPSIDILRFFYSSLAENVVKNHFDLLIREYHATLKDTLELFGMSSPTLEDLWKDINSHGFFAMTLVFGWPFTRAQKGQTPNLEKALNKEGGITTEVFNSPKISRLLKDFLVDFRKRGWLCEDEVQCNIPL